MWLSVLVIVATAARAHYLFQPSTGSVTSGQVLGNVTGNFSCGILPEYSYVEEFNTTFVYIYTPEWQNVIPREMVGDASECTEEKSCGSLGDQLFCIDGFTARLTYSNMARRVVKLEGSYFAFPIYMSMSHLHDFFTLQVESASAVSLGGGEYKKRHFVVAFGFQIVEMLLTPSFIVGPTSGPFRLLLSVTNDTRWVPFYRELRIDVRKSNEFSPPETLRLEALTSSVIPVEAAAGEPYCNFSITSTIPFGFFVVPSLVAETEFFGGCDYFQSLGCTKVVIIGTSDVVNQFLSNLRLDVGEDDGIVSYITAYSNRTFERSTRVIVTFPVVTVAPVNNFVASLIGGLSTVIAVLSLFSIILIIMIRKEAKKFFARTKQVFAAARGSLAAGATASKV